MSLPELTPLQFAALSLLFSGEKTARQLREQLESRGGPKTPAAFSQLMGRLQKGTYIVAGRECRADRRASQCRYRVTDLGVIVWQATRKFYASFPPPPPDLEPVATDEAEFAEHPSGRRGALVKQKYFNALLRAFRRRQEALRR